jgi:4-amino-4-deoxy-L-arabinose transferase-like glycosyltransferase
VCRKCLRHGVGLPARDGASRSDAIRPRVLGRSPGIGWPCRPWRQHSCGGIDSRAHERKRASLLTVRRVALLLFAGVFALKVAVAAELGLFGDEAFYWQCSQRLAFAYADHPPLTAVLIRAGTELVGDSAFGVRLLFLVMGALFPFVIYHLARPLVGGEDAALAALCSFAVPGLAHMGVAAVPDVPLLFFGALYLLGCERATRTGQWRWWVLAGVTGALGLATHYRFVLAPLAAALFAVLSPVGRRHLKTPGLWVSVALLCLGLIPSIAFNVLNDFAPLRYYLGSRHGAGLHLRAPAVFVGAQVGIASPLLFVAFIAAIKGLVRRGAKGDDRARLLAVFAAVPLGLFFLASPFETTRLARHHWPIPGYVPLLVYVPHVLRRFAHGGGGRRALAVAAPLLGIALVLLVGVELLSGVANTSYRRPFAGWSDVTRAVEERLAREDLIVVADNYKLGANLEFESRGRIAPYVLRHPKNVAHGRASQFKSWSLGEDALDSQRGRNALVVIQTKELRSEDRPAWRARVAARFARFESLGEVIVYVGRRSKRFELIYATDLRPRR